MSIKIGIVGLGFVGMASAYQLVTRSMCDEIALYDIQENLSIAHCHDLKDSLALCNSYVKISCASHLESLADCDIIILSFRKTHFSSLGSRLDELKNNADELKQIVPVLKNAGFKGFYVIATNPNDSIVYLTHHLSGLEKHQIIGSGTNLDSSRLKKIIADELALHPNDINAFMLAEHGDTQFAYLSHAFVKNGVNLGEFYAQMGKKLDIEALERAVVDEGYFIYNKKGRTEYGIGSSCAMICEAIAKDKKMILPLSSVFEDYALSLPVLLGKNGVERVFECEFDEREARAFAKSKEAIKKAIQSVI